ncbi:NACHT and WD repeat domain-containing protein 2-like isoform X1 [Alosa alosa]|uniref:NACHT and WD repeat domain-containing protein 2-like isoform X1 n=1 Tax=Alosa alosa TaxID=278164 RepID=UPI0020153F42|nr:NACHT and WD repeat domain-containing protein 2-like isoform X1 [Alosa alosa]
MPCVKIYLCSNPQDSVQERRALRETVFPKLRDHCRRNHGVEFRVIDPYEAPNSKDWPSQQVRLRLIQGCKDTSVGPFFVGLIGEEYGTASLPEQVEISEFQNILQTCQSMQLSTRLLEECYRRDENVIPPCFCLLSQHSSQTEAITGTKTWDEALKEVKDVLQASVKQCILDGSITEEKAQKYFRSDLENDLRFAMEDCLSDDMKRCLYYIHKIIHQKKTGHDQDQDPSNDRLSVIREHFLPDLVTSCHLEVYTTTTECDRQQGYTVALRQAYIEGLCHQLFTDLSRLIDSTVTKNTADPDDATSQQANLCHIYSQLFRIERVEAQPIKAYLEQNYPKHPLVLIGGPCSGKTVLMAHCASQVKLWLKAGDPVVITHFSPLPLKQLLNNICHHIAVSYNQPWDNCIRDVTQLEEAFTELLDIASSSKYPLILMLDGLDQIPSSEGPQHMTWLPKTLPLNVKVIISTTYTKSGTLASLKTQYPDSNFFLELEPFKRSSCSQMLTSLLESSKRRITSGQQMYVNEALKQCSRPLYAELIYRNVSLWRSETEITEESLSQGIHNNINQFLQHLEEKHGQALVSRSLSFLTLSRFGLTEAELTDILSCEDDLVSVFLPIEDPPYKLRFPEVVVERLIFDLEGFLLARHISGSRVLFWVSRHFRLVIIKRYIDSIDKSEEIHLRLADYFSGRFAYGRAKPLVITSDTNMTDKQGTTEGKPMKMYIDRNPYGQPWVWKMSKPSITFQDSSSETGNVNFRKVLELPYHLRWSGGLDEFCRGSMLSYDFHHAMLMGGLVQDLFLWLEEMSQFMMPRELWLLACILRSSLCLLQNSPIDTPLIIQAQLFPFLGVVPELEDYAKQLCVGYVRSGITMVLPPASSVPCSSWELSDRMRSSVTDVAIADSGRVVLLLSDGSAWAWNGITSKQFQVPHVPTIKMVSLRISNTYLLLSSSCNRLFLCDLRTMFFEEVPVLNTEIHQNTHISIEGFLASTTKMFWWYRGEHHVYMHATDDASPNCGITQLYCPGFVTCISCSFDEQHVFCGQGNGNVSIFDVQSGQTVSALSCSTERPLIGLKRVEEEVMACIDSVGSLFIWNIQNISHPSLSTESLSNKDTEEVLNIDFTEDNEVLLICKKQKIILWDTNSCSVDDQFHAPKGKAFVHVMLDHGSSLLLALLEGCSCLLVWDSCTGQCVLSLNTGSTETPKLFKVGDQYLSAVTVNGIVTWDMDLVREAASIPKTGSKTIKMVLVKSDNFYTSDGTELLWKWNAQSGEKEGCFLHHGPVTAFTISQDGEHLVTVASGDIYVWRSGDGVNLYCIPGSAASQVLITPTGNVAVSLSDQGLSRVWKVANGHEVCRFHLRLEKPVISPESTFLLGLQEDNLLAVSLWFGYVSREFPLSDQSRVLAFNSILDHPDYVIVITSSGAVYSWKMSDDTICQRFQMPEHLLDQPGVFQVCADGSYAILTIGQSDMNILDVTQGRLCAVKVNGQIHHVCLDISGKYAAYISETTISHLSCSCKPCVRLVLTAIRVSNGMRVGRFYLCRYPCAMSISDNLSVYVIFEDGSVGIYAITDTDAEQSATATKTLLPIVGQRHHPCTAQTWQPLAVEKWNNTLNMSVRLGAESFR